MFLTKFNHAESKILSKIDPCFVAIICAAKYFLIAIFARFNKGESVAEIKLKCLIHSYLKDF